MQLFTTHPSITDAEMQRQSRLLARCLAVLTFVFLCVDVTLSLGSDDYTPPWPGYVVLTATFALNRFGQYRVAAALAMAMFPLVGIGHVAFQAALYPLLTLGYLALAPILGAIFLPVWGVIALTLLNLSGIVGLAAVVPSVGALGAQLVGPLSLNLMMGVLSCLYTLHRNAVEEDRRKALLTEVAERRALEDRLRHAQKLETLGQFAGGIAHDFNNVLMVVGGNAALLARRTPAPELERIEAAVSSAASLTKQLLAFGRRTVLEPHVLDLNQVVRDSAEMLRRIIGENIAIRVTVPEHPVRIFADRSQLEQVLLNLVTNARDAMPSGGSLELEVAEHAPDHDSHAGRQTSRSGTGYACLKVRDSGVGMDATTQERIFDPFFTTKPRGRGTGLGLASVHGIVEQSGGVVRVRSVRGEGSTFEVYFPLTGESERTQPVLVHRSAAGPGGRVLVVEDEGAVRRVVTEILADAGYDALAVGSLREARHVFESEAAGIALVLTDLVLSDGHGLELVNTLRREHPTVALICMSGYAELDSEGGLPADVPHLQKPFGADELLAKIRTQLEARASRAAEGSQRLLA